MVVTNIRFSGHQPESRTENQWGWRELPSPHGRSELPGSRRQEVISPEITLMKCSKKCYESRFFWADVVKGGPYWPMQSNITWIAKSGPKISYPNVALKILLTCFGTFCIPIHFQSWPSFSQMVNTITITITHYYFQADNKPWPCWSSSPSSSPRSPLSSL